MKDRLFKAYIVVPYLVGLRFVIMNITVLSEIGCKLKMLYAKKIPVYTGAGSRRFYVFIYLNLI
jgi:hypothetical protein